MNRISTKFSELKAQGRKALIPFITAGDPKIPATLGYMHALVEAGADIIELGVPFSDPMADGPTIQKASDRALRQGTRLVDVLNMVADFRKTDTTTPVVLMGYLNPIENLGYEKFVDLAAAAGVDGVLVVDLPPDEADDFISLMRAKNMDCIFLLTPATQLDRAKKIVSAASGYLYYVSIKGVTGTQEVDVADVKYHLDRFAGITDLPIAVGFGIRNAASAKALAAISSGVIVGSALVNKVEEFATQEEKIGPAMAEILSSMRQAMDEE